jgi:hypothetical protein
MANAVEATETPSATAAQVSTARPTAREGTKVMTTAPRSRTVAGWEGRKHEGVSGPWI